MYSVASHLDMVTDWVRTGAYQEALRREVRPGCTVADIGTGTGIFAVFACEFGARRVYAIEPDSIVEVARGVVTANGVGDRVELISEMSTRVELPETVDVIVSDIGGVLPLFGDRRPISHRRSRTPAGCWRRSDPDAGAAVGGSGRGAQAVPV